MKFLFVHQNFPGQFRHVAAALADIPEHQVVAVGEAVNLKGRPLLHPRVQLMGYERHGGAGEKTHHYLRDFEGAVRRGQTVARSMQSLKAKGFNPDVVVAHPAWGEAMFLRDLFPEARHVYYFEYYYDGYSGDVGFDPEFPAQLDDRLKARIKNSSQLQALVAADEGISPTVWQKSRYPKEFQSKIRVLHEGINTELICPDAQAFFETGGQRFAPGDEVVTYVARNLEPYRGFHTFMRALPSLLAARPKAQVLIVGGDNVSYGRRLPQGQNYRARYSAEIRDQVDWSRIHFLGKLPYGEYLRVLRVSAAHVYLTYPFVLSWSMLEAMAAGCVVVGSDTAPVREVIRDGENGLLVDFFDPEALGRRIGEVLYNPGKFAEMRNKARSTVVEQYDLDRRCLPVMLGSLQGR